MTPVRTPLKFLGLQWFGSVMGLAALALAWQRAVPVFGDLAATVALGLALLALAVGVVLAAAGMVRARRHPQALAEDLRHPVRHPFAATVPISLLLLATAWVVLAGPNRGAEALWLLGSLGALGTTVWMLARWARGGQLAPQAGGFGWPSVTPLLLLPVVGDALVPLAGVALDHAAWSAAQLGIGLLLWPVVVVLLVVRLVVAGPWPERLLPVGFLLVAPPAVIGAALLRLGASPLAGWIAWGMALAMLLWVTLQAPRLLAMPFTPTHWAAGFPLAAFAGLTLTLADEPLARTLAPLVLALASLVNLALVVATLRGLRDGTLLAPEPLAAIVPAGPGPGAGQ